MSYTGYLLKIDVIAPTSA